MTEYRELYCKSCKKVIGRYNIKYYSDDKIGDIIKLRHGDHVKVGHDVILQRVKYKSKMSKL